MKHMCILMCLYLTDNIACYRCCIHISSILLTKKLAYIYVEFLSISILEIMLEIEIQKDKKYKEIYESINGLNTCVNPNVLVFRDTTFQHVFNPSG